MKNDDFNHLGIPSSHRWYEIGCILEIVERHEINLFIELGFQHGGLGSILATRTILVDGFQYFGLEENMASIHPQFFQLVSMLPDARIIIGDVFSLDAQKVVERSMKEVGGRTLIHCDNGDKPREFREYSLKLKPDDLIMVHDYPKEFSDQHIKNKDRFERIETDFLKDTRMVLFKRRRDD